MSVSSVFYQSRNKAYQEAIKAITTGTNYMVNNERGARQAGKRNIRVAQSFLQSEVPLNATTSQYVFNTTDQPNIGTTSIGPQEQRLNLQDVFFTYAIGFFLKVNLFSGSTVPQFQYATYPSPSIMGPAPGMIPDVTALMGIWTGGRLEVKVNGEQLTPSWDLAQHCVINQTESNVSSAPINPLWDQQNFAEDGFVITEPNWILNGGNLNLYTVNYGNNWNLVLNGTNAAATGVSLSIVMKWYGWLAQNASSIMNNQPAQ